ncbi:MAG: hypothetical protein COX20_05710 [Desulfobacterales bacterium CG23_combo_of_CG06-09_8_20_14_all_52_9]|nr:MAG: hypothetical protein COX20_05710 [Desulfobacterales bacterium CG23_combo_of_CG06-09_8_20_14_all_52_9]
MVETTDSKGMYRVLGLPFRFSEDPQTHPSVLLPSAKIRPPFWKSWVFLKKKSGNWRETR